MLKDTRGNAISLVAKRDSAMRCCYQSLIIKVRYYSDRFAGVSSQCRISLLKKFKFHSWVCFPKIVHNDCVILIHNTRIKQRSGPITLQLSKISESKPINTLIHRQLHIQEINGSVRREANLHGRTQKSNLSGKKPPS